MLKPAYSYLIAVILLSGIASARCATTNSALKFHIVRDQKLEGGKLIDTPKFPKTGYISNLPELVVTNLVDVHETEQSTSIINGKAVPSRFSSSLTVTLTSDDAKRFSALTEKAVGKRLLVSLGDTPLTAPRVMGKIESDSFSIDLNDEVELKKVHEQIKKLVIPVTPRR